MAGRASGAGANNTSVITYRQSRLSHLWVVAATKSLLWNMEAEGQALCLMLTRRMSAVDEPRRGRL